MKLYIGVDGGGTKTEALIFDVEASRAVVSTGGASNPSTVGWDNAVSTVDGVIQRGIGALDGRVQDIVAVSLCMSGIDRPEQISQMTQLFQEKYPSAKIEVVNDGLAALAAGTRGESGIVVIAGTGSIAVGEDRDGKTARAGGYGSLIGDEGGGFDIGRQGLMAAIQYAEGRGPKTRLWDVAVQVFDLNGPGEIIPRIYNSTHPVGAVASFARYVLETAGDDELAAAIVDRSTTHHVRMIESVRKQLGGNVSNSVVLAGGLFTNTAVLRDGLSQKLSAVVPNATCTPVTHRPSAGALLRAIRMIHQPVTEDLVRAWENGVKTATTT